MKRWKDTRLVAALAQKNVIRSISYAKHSKNAI